MSIYQDVEPQPAMDLKKGQYWITKEGKKINISKMSDKHLINAYRMTKYPNLKQEIFDRMIERVFGCQNENNMQ